MERQTTLEMLQRSLDDLKRYVAETPNDALHWREGKEWSVHETMAHLAEVEQNVYLVRIQQVASDDKPTLRYFDEEAWHQAHYKPELAAAQLLTDFAYARQQMLDVLRSHADWTRWGLHERQKKQMSLAYLAHSAVRHTWEHLDQMAKAVLAWELARQK